PDQSAYQIARLDHFFQLVQQLPWSFQVLLLLSESPDWFSSSDCQRFRLRHQSPFQFLPLDYLSLP
ncbi:hypothetical protein LINPERPRIM_LOCUS18737, partial [Linum perenne]